MRKALVRVGGQESISEVLRRIGPVELDTYLEDGPGFRVRFVGQEAQQAQKAETPRRYLFEGTGLAAHVAIEYNTELSVAVQHVTLTNTGYEPTPPSRM
jgi:hypothetical protein